VVKNSGTSKILENIEEIESPGAEKSIESRIEDLIKAGFDAAKRYGRGDNTVTLSSLKGVEIHPYIA
jgi:hypothetical protein